jgi:DNA 3'-phosphatase
MNLQEKKILFADLDGTLITTASGKTFAEDCTDFRIRKEVLDKIKTMTGLKYLAIVTNQGGVPQYISQHDVEVKIKSIVEFIRSYFSQTPFSPDDVLTINAEYCASMEKDHPCRKPNTGMLENFFRYPGTEGIEKSAMLMIGDASGKEGQFSDSDKKCAENFGIDYLDVEDFLKTL